MRERERERGKEEKTKKKKKAIRLCCSDGIIKDNNSYLLLCYIRRTYTLLRDILERQTKNDEKEEEEEIVKKQKAIDRWIIITICVCQPNFSVVTTLNINNHGEY